MHVVVDEAGEDGASDLGGVVIAFAGVLMYHSCYDSLHIVSAL